MFIVQRRRLVVLREEFSEDGIAVGLFLDDRVDGWEVC